MPEKRLNSTICLATIGHDPEGRWVDHLSRSNPVLASLFPARIISLTDETHNSTIDTAFFLGWRVEVENLPVGSARFAVIRRGLEIGVPFINYWDGDRILYAAQNGVEDLRDIQRRIPQYDCFIAGATRKAITTHQSSMTCWEEVKSWALGHYLGIKGDIATRGCFGFSKEYAQLLIQHELTTGDDTDAIFAILPLAFRKLIESGQLPATGRETIGYRAYSKATSYEDWLFEGLTSEESRNRKDTQQDFTRRAESVLRQIILAQDIGRRYDLGFPSPGASMQEIINCLAQ